VASVFTPPSDILLQNSKSPRTSHSTEIHLLCRRTIRGLLIAGNTRCIMARQ